MTKNFENVETKEIMDDIDMEYEAILQERKAYLENLQRDQIKIELTDFFFVEDEIYPDEFELILVIDKDGHLSAGCVDNGSAYRSYGSCGVIRQGRDGIISFDDIIAWKPIDGLKVLDIECE